MSLRSSLAQVELPGVACCVARRTPDRKRCGWSTRRGVSLVPPQEHVFVLLFLLHYGRSEYITQGLLSISCEHPHQYVHPFLSCSRTLWVSYCCTLCRWRGHLTTFLSLRHNTNMPLCQLFNIPFCSQYLGFISLHVLCPPAWSALCLPLSSKVQSSFVTVFTALPKASSSQ